MNLKFLRHSMFENEIYCFSARQPHLINSLRHFVCIWKVCAQTAHKHIKNNTEAIKKNYVLPFVSCITESGSCSPPRVLMLLSIKARSGGGSHY